MRQLRILNRTLLSVKIDIAQRFTRIWRLFRPPERFRELLVKQVVLVTFRVDGLPEDTLFPFLLFPHGAGSSLEIFKGTLARCGSMRNDGAEIRIDPENATTIGADDVKGIATGRSTAHRPIVGVPHGQCQTGGSRAGC